MTRLFVLRARAERDIQSAFEWYESQRAGLGAEFRAALRERLEAVRVHPESSPVLYRGFGVPWYRGSRILFSTLRGQNVSPYSRCFTTRAIRRSGPVVRNVPANHGVDADRFAAGHAGR